MLLVPRKTRHRAAGGFRIWSQIGVVAASINAAGRNYGTAPQAASYHGCESVVQLLLDWDANVNAEDEEHDSALHIASSRGHEAVVQLLQAVSKPQ